ncbi:pentapeptide repeat-containing protein [Streptomyces sp. NPDC002870]|uniref:pentapeptide repeat-containing protein n=1 Tax=Streptomyces sp. NPDC002870 TaxID=3364666 RepID=UPI0036C97242
MDHRGTTFSTELLRELTTALHDGTRSLFGNASFLGATFSGDAGFEGATFSGNAEFHSVTFNSYALFHGATFNREAGFVQATFSRTAKFIDATFSGRALFALATFSGDAEFSEATFSGDARFGLAKFTGHAWFNMATFSGDAGFGEAKFGRFAGFSGARFDANAGFYGAKFSDKTQFHAVTVDGDAEFYGATFEDAELLGPLVCGGELALSGAVFQRPVTIEAAAQRLECVRTQWISTAGLRLRYATVDLTDAVFEYPVTVLSRRVPCTINGTPMAEDVLAGLPRTVRMRSLSGVDAAHLVLTDIDLSVCRFAGTVHLDQLRLEGECPLAQTPQGVRWRCGLPLRWTVRGTLLEEHHWRHSSGASGWVAPDGAEALEPAALAPVYRQLRKAFEDGKNEPEAADFYYGEMEMRRKNTKRTVPERALLTLYWAVSGYGLRASRALAWLLVAMLTTMMLMMLWGVAKDDPKPESKGTVKGQQIALTTDKPDPVNPDGSLASRVSTDRFEKSARVVINSVVFRSSGQDLTTAGTYTEMVSRLVEPVLLGLAVLAVRGRVKR